MLAEGPAPGDDPLGVASQGGAEAEDEELAATGEGRCLGRCFRFWAEEPVQRLIPLRFRHRCLSQLRCYICPHRSVHQDSRRQLQRVESTRLCMQVLGTGHMAFACLG